MTAYRPDCMFYFTCNRSLSCPGSQLFIGLLKYIFLTTTLQHTVVFGRRRRQSFTIHMERFKKSKPSPTAIENTETITLGFKIALNVLCTFTVLPRS